MYSDTMFTINYCVFFMYYNISDNSSQPIWINNFPCVSRQPCIGNCIGCSSTSLLSTECNHSNDVTIECRKLTNSVFDNTLTVVLNFTDTDSPDSYTETTNETCTFSQSKSYACIYTLKQVMKPI